MIKEVKNLKFKVPMLFGDTVKDVEAIIPNAVVEYTENEKGEQFVDHVETYDCIQFCLTEEQSKYFEEEEH